jgi:myo-inositol-1(or 4)-monophosphatase
MKEIALQAARAGGQVLMNKFGFSLVIEHKGEIDLVTDADRAAEKAIVNVLRGTFPRHDILAEEADYEQMNSSYRWIIDPLDGTTNFAHGLPWFAVSIALSINDKIVLGVVFQPYSGEMFVAEKGKGAFLNDSRIHVSRTGAMEQALLATGFPYDLKQSPVNNLDHFSHFQLTAQGCRRAGAASLDLANTAAGRLDGYWEMKLKPWDMAAGKLLVEEAGGRVSDFDGAPLGLSGQECLASNGLLHQAMQDILQKGRRP